KRGYAAVKGLEGQRYIANGLGPGKLELWGTLGNASLNLVRGMEVYVYGDVQEDVGDCAENSMVAIYGNAGDSLAQAMRSGEVYVYGNAGNRVGVQMKGGYIVVGGDVGDYLGEFMAGGLILVLGKPGKYIGTGMVGGKIIIRGSIPLTHIGIAPPRSQLEKLIQKLNEIGVIGREELVKALHAKTVDELREALGDAFRFLEKLWGSLHLGYPKPEYRYLHDDEQETVRRLLEKFNMLFKAKIDIDSLLLEKFTVITRSKA
ncbi:MAG TPA: glutamate synthase, partial [Pyrodictiaceae archaeon]|nr:glutamate synthase [Pyrodictiaceae archaeon]